MYPSYPTYNPPRKEALGGQKMLLHLDTDFTVNQCRPLRKPPPPPPPPLPLPLFEPLTPAVPTVVCVLFFLLVRRQRGLILKIVARPGSAVGEAGGGWSWHEMKVAAWNV